jgi:hypothetical protein
MPFLACNEHVSESEIKKLSLIVLHAWNQKQETLQEGKHELLAQKYMEQAESWRHVADYQRDTVTHLFMNF